MNYASKTSGAIIVDKSGSSKGMGNVLVDDKDKYALTPCEDEQWAVVGLSEEIQVTRITISNYERYSSTTKDFQLLGATSFPAASWQDLGNFRANATTGEQVRRGASEGGGGSRGSGRGFASAALSLVLGKPGLEARAMR